MYAKLEIYLGRSEKNILKLWANINIWFNITKINKFISVILWPLWQIMGLHIFLLKKELCKVSTYLCKLSIDNVIIYQINHTKSSL